MKISISDAVIEVLKDDPLSKECDNRMILLVCQRLGHDLTQEQLEMIGSLPNLAGIVRSRARIQSAGRFRPRPEIWQQRHSHRRKQ